MRKQVQDEKIFPVSATPTVGKIPIASLWRSQGSECKGPDYNTISASATFGGSDTLDSIVECTSYPKTTMCSQCDVIAIQMHFSDNE
jgi:hypothetical protein